MGNVYMVGTTPNYYVYIGYVYIYIYIYIYTYIYICISISISICINFNSALLLKAYTNMSIYDKIVIFKFLLIVDKFILKIVIYIYILFKLKL